MPFGGHHLSILQIVIYFTGLKVFIKDLSEKDGGCICAILHFLIIFGLFYQFFILVFKFSILNNLLVSIKLVLTYIQRHLFS